MHATTSYIQYSTDYPSLLSYAHNHHHLNASTSTHASSISPNSTHLLSYSGYNTGLDLPLYSNNIKQLQSDDEDDNQSISSSLDNTINGALIPFKKRSRTVPVEEKDTTYYEKRTRNNESAKRSRDTRRIKEQQIQKRVTFLEHENLRLSMENQAIRYQLSQLHTLCDRVSKPLQ
ncbi:unnamed protein product [Rotaria sp. Silwood2]|nr:unnamed protein product [Rotaria sp. Silwood2]CAF2779597.1 unnamed protein product [Rotaria sp. Silwood2]CAF2953913.1 unnamed protein product [Rotaria sp. Silwood2]CAF3902739.1 unnamed protein product [Rotaria sp. Silwood2]CAF4056101.1 unnamed protein product [Rotaria sp. Silwood2]